MIADSYVHDDSKVWFYYIIRVYRYIDQTKAYTMMVGQTHVEVHFSFIFEWVDVHLSVLWKSNQRVRAMVISIEKSY